jgi:hypothetical protein
MSGHKIVGNLDNGRVPVRYSGWILVCCGMRRSHMHMRCRYILHFLFINSPFSLYTPVAMSISEMSFVDKGLGVYVIDGAG